MTDQQPFDFNNGKKKKKKKKANAGIDRQPPFNLDAEAGVLGSLMLTPDACDDVVSIYVPKTSTTKLMRSSFAI